MLDETTQTPQQEQDQSQVVPETTTTSLVSWQSILDDLAERYSAAMLMRNLSERIAVLDAILDEIDEAQDKVLPDFKDYMNAIRLAVVEASSAAEEELASADWGKEVDGLTLKFAFYKSLYLKDDPQLSSNIADMEQLRRDATDLYEQVPDDFHHDLNEIISGLDTYVSHARELAMGRQEYIQQQVQVMLDGLYAETLVWSEFDPSNQYNPEEMIERHGNLIPGFVSEWRPFTPGGTIPSVITWIRSNMEVGDVKQWINEEVGEALYEKGVIAYPVAFEGGTTGSASMAAGLANLETPLYNEEMSFRDIEAALDDINAELLPRLRDRMAQGEDHLMHWETVFDEYFQYVNETQFLNQWFYGRIFFPTLAKIGGFFVKQFIRLMPNNVLWGNLARRSIRTRQLVIEMARQGHPEACYNYLLENILQDSYNPSGVVNQGFKVPVIGTAPPNNWDAIKAAMKKLLVSEGVFIDERTFINTIWPQVMAMGPDDLSTAIQQASFLQSLKLNVLAVRPVNGAVQNVLGGPIARTISQVDLEPFMKSAYSAITLPGLGETPSFFSSMAGYNFGSGWMTAGGDISAFLSRGLTPILRDSVYAPSALQQHAIGGGASTATSGGIDIALDNFEEIENALGEVVAAKVEERSEEIMNNALVQSYDVVRGQIEQKMRNHAYNSPEEIEADMTAFVQEHEPEIGEEVVRVAEDVIANLTDEEWDMIVSAPETEDSEQEAAAWLRRAASIVATISNMSEVGAAQAAFAELTKMSGTAPGGGDTKVQLEAELERRYISTIGPVVRDMAIGQTRGAA